MEPPSSIFDALHLDPIEHADDEHRPQRLNDDERDGVEEGIREIMRVRANRS